MKKYFEVEGCGIRGQGLSLELAEENWKDKIEDLIEAVAVWRYGPDFNIDNACKQLQETFDRIKRAP